MSGSVVVTGCGTGLGRAIFERLIKDGWAVVGLELDEARAADARQVAGAGDVLVGDAGSRDDLHRARERAVALAPLGGWVNNAALPIQGNLHDLNPDEVERLFRVSLMGYFWGCSEAVQQFVAQRSGGAIVNVSSIHALETTPLLASYAAAKAALVSLTRSAALEGKPRGIRVNCVLPGAVDTPMLWSNPKVAAGLERIDPADVGSTDDVAAAIAYLASTDAAFVQGAMLRVDGGRIDRL
jgi:NAD(P)-dependent dehydrogenase (short-subunit alcohol dehydrogenase family)